MSIEEIQKRVEAAGQGHLFKEWPNLCPEERERMVVDIQVHTSPSLFSSTTSLLRKWILKNSMPHSKQPCIQWVRPQSSLNDLHDACLLEIEMEEEVLQPATDVIPLKADAT